MPVSRHMRLLTATLLLLSVVVAAAPSTTRPTNATTTAPTATTRPTTKPPTKPPTVPTTTPPATPSTVPSTSPPDMPPTTPPTTTPPTSAPVDAASSLTTAPAVSTINSASSSGGGTDRTTMIVIVGCVVAVFAVVVVIAIFRSRKPRDHHDAAPATPLDESAQAYSAPAVLKVRARPTHVTPYKSLDSQRPSQTHTERTTLPSSPRESVLVVVEHGQLDRMASEDDVAMLESYAQSRAFEDGTFLSAVNFNDSSRSLDVDSSRSLDVDAYRRSAELSDTNLTSNSNTSAYWRHPEDTMFYADEDEDDDANASTLSFTDAVEPPRRQTSVDL